jgi:TorA maturation chaperone TorD
MILAFWGPLERFLSSLHKVDSADRAELEAAHVRHFMLTSEGIACPPYESAYLPREAVGWLMAELDRQYARAGFAVNPAFGESPDHAAVELEFMSVLCGDEARAWKRERFADGVERLDRQAGFLDQRLCRWFPELARRVASRDESGFYAIATDAARTFIAHDLELVTALLGRFRGAGWR